MIAFESLVSCPIFGVISRRLALQMAFKALSLLTIFIGPLLTAYVGGRLISYPLPTTRALTFRVSLARFQSSNAVVKPRV